MNINNYPLSSLSVLTIKEQGFFNGCGKPDKEFYDDYEKVPSAFFYNKVNLINYNSYKKDEWTIQLQVKLNNYATA